MELKDTLDRVYRSEFSMDNFDTDLHEVYRLGRPFVSIQRFLDDDYYFGKIARDLYPENRPDLEDIFDPTNNYLEVILGGAIGWGKTFLACLGLAYMIGQLSSYINPHKWLGASPTSPIIFMNMSVTGKKAKEVIFTRTKTMIDSCQYFKDVFNRNTRLIDSMEWNVNQKELGSRSGQLIIFKPGTGESLSALGDDIYGGACDELNFFRVIEKSKRAFGESFDPAQNLYDTVVRRMKSRFMSGGLMLGKLFLVSSAQVPEDFIERRTEEAEQTGELGDTVKVIRKSAWEGKKGVFVGGKPAYNEKTFRVAIGTARSSSRLLDKYDVQTGVVTPVVSDADVTSKIIHPPIDLWMDFLRDIEGSVRDFGGEVTRAIYPFFQDSEVIYDAVSNDFEHPWMAEETTLQDGQRMIIGMLFILNEKTGKWVPKRHPKRSRYWHIDMGLSNDALGLAIVHVVGWKQVKVAHDLFEDLPIIETDLMLRVKAPVGKEISFGNVRSVLYHLQNHGMFLRKGSCDLKMMSADFLQIVGTRGLSAEHLSVDTDMAPYDILKSTIYDGRLVMYNYNPVIDELIRLEKTPTKVDHPAQGSKDVSDALAGACYNAFVNELGVSSQIRDSMLPHMDKSEKKETMKQRLLSAEEEMREWLGGSKEIKGRR